MIKKTEFAAACIFEPLIMCDAEPEQLEYIRKYYMEQWKKRQEKEIEDLIDAYVRDRTIVISKYTIPPPSGWMRYAKDYICKYLQYWDKCAWIEFLCIQEDDSHFMTRHGEKLQKHLIRIRNYAREVYGWESRTGISG